MKQFGVIFCFIVLASACGNSSEVVSSRTTTVTVAPSKTVTTTTFTPTTVVPTITTVPEATVASAVMTEPTVEDTAPKLTPEPKSDTPSGSQPFNPFTSTDLILRDCLLDVFGQTLHDELRNRQPTPDENAAMEPCMAAFMALVNPNPKNSDAEDGPAGFSLITESAREVYPPQVTGQLLLGYIPVPPGFDDCIITWIGGDRLGEIRSKQPPSGDENDRAAECLFQLQVPVGLLEGQGGRTGHEFGDNGALEGSVNPGSAFNEDGDQADELTEHITTVSYPSTNYPVAPEISSGFFTSGQDAGIVLSAFGFNDTGGPLFFNYPSGLSSDGTKLIMADTWNNRVLIWNTAPASARAPDLVLGQSNFTTNDAGRGRGQMNWPVSTSTDGTRLVVTDTMNDRILIWNTFPTTNGQPADLVLEGDKSRPSKSRIEWPWGVWTDGRRLAVSNTAISSVLIWNNFPTADSQPADLLLTGSGGMGTPRQITSNGNTLLIGDHNAMASGTDQNSLANSGSGTFFWSTFPTVDEQPHDFFLTDPPGEETYGTWLRGDFTDDGRLFTMDKTLRVWNSPPLSATASADLALIGQGDEGGFDFRGSDFSSVVIVGERVYITIAGDILVYDSLPYSPFQIPDFAIGATDIYSDARKDNFIIGNPVPASNGTSLFVSSGLDKRLYVWKNLPDESGAIPDIVYDFCSYRNEETRRRHQCLDGQFQPVANALSGNTFALAGRDQLIIWTELPLTGNLPNLEFRGSIGSVPLLNLTGVAVDDRYFYLADGPANAVYVWDGIPDGTTDPVAVLSVFAPEAMSSDGTYLTVSTPAARPRRSEVFLVDEINGLGSLTSDITGDVDLPVGTIVANGSFFAADINNSQILVWEDIADALSGLSADAILGASGPTDTRPEISRNQLFWPGTVSFDGSYLWVGEYKFSGRLLRFNPIG